MPRRASPKREREYNELEEKFEKEDRHKGRVAEAPERTGSKQRNAQSETKDQKNK
jgi:hypothetical protein